MEAGQPVHFYFPTTRQSLLSSCRSPQSSRWGEFLNRYYSAVEQYVKNHFSDLDDDGQANVVQDTFIELAESLPSFSYEDNPDRKFRWHLIAVAKYKGYEQRRKQERQRAKDGGIQFLKDERFLDDLSSDAIRLGLVESQDEIELSHARQKIVDLVVEGLVADDETFSAETRDVFWRIVVNGEKPADVARDMGVSRDVVDHMKSRMMKKFKPCYKRMLKAHGISE